MQGRAAWVTSWFLLLAWLPALASPVYQGKVVHVADENTLIILVSSKPLEARLAEIDTPEKGLPFGTRAKQALGTLAIGKRGSSRWTGIGTVGLSDGHKWAAPT
jgi:endonuclease YncB( thermonuclease family)